MASPEEIANQQERLSIHRRNLAELLKQHALNGPGLAPLSILNGISHERDNIQRIKQILRDWQAPTVNHPDDGDLTPAPLSPALAAPLGLGQLFLCYAPRDGAEHALRLHHAMGQAGLRPWLDQRDTPAGYDPEAAREEALRECAALLLLLTPASAELQSEATHEWRRALQYKKPIIALRMLPDVELPLMLGERPLLDLTGPLEPAMPALAQQIADLATPAGQLRELEYRLADAERALRSAPEEQRARVVRDVIQLTAEVATQRAIVRDPQAAEKAAARTAAAIARERQPEQPLAGRASSKFINPPPLVAPSYFQDRHIESQLAKTPALLSALDAKALALAGLGRSAEARAAYHAARDVNSERGVVRRAAWLLGQLAGVERFWEG